MTQFPPAAALCDHSRHVLSEDVDARHRPRGSHCIPQTRSSWPSSSATSSIVTALASEKSGGADGGGGAELAGGGSGAGEGSGGGSEGLPRPRNDSISASIDVTARSKLFRKNHDGRRDVDVAFSRAPRASIEMASSCATFLHACSSLALGQRRASAPRASTSRHRVRARAAPPAGGPDDASEGEWNPARGPPGAERDRYRAPAEYDYDYAPPSQRGGGGPWESARGAPPGGGRGLGQGGDGGGGGGNNAVTNFLIAGAFVVGMGAGVAFDTSVNLEPSNVASRDILDRQTPSSEVCMANGASAMVFDQRVFLSLNPFNMYVAQPEVKPGCVLRRSNWNVLERNQLVDETMEKDCKRGMNTFAFVGDLDKSPEVSCVYHSEEAENQFMKDPRKAVLGDGEQPRPNLANKSFR